MARERSIVACIGAKGQGKTGAVTVPYVLRYVTRNGLESVRGLDPSGALARAMPRLAPRFEWPGRKQVMSWFNEITGDGEGPDGGGFTGLIVLDDADRFLRPHIQEEVIDVFLANRHLTLDVLLNVHRPQNISKEIINSADELWIFRLGDPLAWDYLRCISILRPVVDADEYVKRKRLTDAEASDYRRAQRVPRMPRRKGEALHVVPERELVELVILFEAAEDDAEAEAEEDAEG